MSKMRDNKNIYLLLGGVGYGFYEPDDERVINCEASESAMVDIAVGLALSGKIPFVYMITPHIFRAFEGVKIYLNYYEVPVKLIGIGRDRDYGDLGYTHWADGDRELFGALRNIEKRWPEKEDIEELLQEAIITPKPYYINLRR